MFMIFDENVDINEENFNVTRTFDLRAATGEDKTHDSRFVAYITTDSAATVNLPNSGWMLAHNVYGTNYYSL